MFPMTPDSRFSLSVWILDLLFSNIAGFSFLKKVFLYRFRLEIGEAFLWLGTGSAEPRNKLSGS